MPPKVANIFNQIPEHLPEELFECLLKTEHVAIERIISKGHASAAGFWHDQDWDEWVLILQGQAMIQFDPDPQTITLTVGDYLLIPAHTRHRLQWTTPASDTVWLAVHIR
jgi:cupin 2 domain-containing protein